jgi:altronate dehydratase small subunit
LEDQVVVLTARDNVATTLAGLTAGETLELRTGDGTVTVRLSADVPFGHKFSLTRIEPGEPVIKYGEVIGTATELIEPGDYVHTHNVVSGRGRGDLERGEV